jgi:Na+/H+-dicarboxylate symporter
MNDFLQIFIVFYLIVNIIFFVVTITYSFHDDFKVGDLRVKHLIYLLLFPFGAIVGVIVASLFEVVDMMLYKVKKNKRFNRFVNRKIFPHRDE